MIFSINLDLIFLIIKKKKEEVTHENKVNISFQLQIASIMAKHALLLTENYVS